MTNYYNFIEKLGKILFVNTPQKKFIFNSNEKDEDGWNSLFNATDNNNIEIVKLLIDYATKKKLF